MTRKFALIASTAVALIAAPAFAETDPSDVTYDPTNTLAGQQVAQIDATIGSPVVMRDGEELGEVEEFKFLEDGRASIVIDMAAGLRLDGDTIELITDADNLTVVGSIIAVNADEDELYKAVGVKGAGPNKVEF
ncbi:hypothetical protein ACERZ8_13775 [Tateyamaria armeniaca]|uniref:PRC-barrel domain-containing protein n=1 Tax=Tateyamaria armeniaca TaxID=2518930 RepID=A0ABW8UY13_9RHOB